MNSSADNNIEFDPALGNSYQQLNGLLLEIEKSKAGDKCRYRRHFPLITCVPKQIEKTVGVLADLEKSDVCPRYRQSLTTDQKFSLLNNLAEKNTRADSWETYGEKRFIVFLSGMIFAAAAPSMMGIHIGMATGIALGGGIAASIIRKTYSAIAVKKIERQMGLISNAFLSCLDQMRADPQVEKTLNQRMAARQIALTAENLQQRAWIQNVKGPGKRGENPENLSP